MEPSLDRCCGNLRSQCGSATRRLGQIIFSRNYKKNIPSTIFLATIWVSHPVLHPFLILTQWKKIHINTLSCGLLALFISTTVPCVPYIISCFRRFKILKNISKICSTLSVILIEFRRNSEVYHFYFCWPSDPLSRALQENCLMAKEENVTHKKVSNLFFRKMWQSNL